MRGLTSVVICTAIASANGEMPFNRAGSVSAPQINPSMVKAPSSGLFGGAAKGPSQRKGEVPFSRAGSVSAPKVNPSLMKASKSGSLGGAAQGPAQRKDDLYFNRAGSVSAPQVNPSLMKAPSSGPVGGAGERLQQKKPAIAGGARGGAVKSDSAQLKYKPRAKLFAAAQSSGARGAPAAGMQSYYEGVHLKNVAANADSLPIRLPALGRTHRTAHKADSGAEVDEDGHAEKPLSLVARMKSVIGLGNENDAASAKPTPPQPTYLNYKGRLYPKATPPTFWEGLYTKVFGETDDQPHVQRAYMDGVSKPNWSLDKAI